MFMEAVQADPTLLANRQPPSKGALDGTIYDRLIGGFIVNLQKRGYTFPPDFYRQISFYLYLYPENMASPEDNLSESTAQTESITVNGSEMHKVNEYTYWLALDETREVFDAHVLDRRIDIDLELDNGESRSVEMSAFPRGQFKIWAEILNTCERESPG